jgi:hypothetical protein
VGDVERIYPKASAPASQAALNAANERAERWRLRTVAAEGKVVRVEALADRWERAGEVMLTAIRGLTNAPRVDGSVATLLAAHDELRAALSEADQ